MDMLREANNLARLLQGANVNVPLALFMVGTATCSRIVGTAASASAAGDPVYLGALAGSFFGGLATMWAAVWVAADAPRRRVAGQFILGASFVPLVVSIGLSNGGHTIF